jgi:hypothetical protein
MKRRDGRLVPAISFFAVRYARSLRISVTQVRVTRASKGDGPGRADSSFEGRFAATSG